MALSFRSAFWGNKGERFKTCTQKTKTSTGTVFDNQTMTVFLFFFYMGSLQLSEHVVQSHQTGEQMTHWAMLNKENSNLVVLFNMSQCVICSPVWRFCTSWSLSCKGPIYRMSPPISNIKSNVFQMTCILYSILFFPPQHYIYFFLIFFIPILPDHIPYCTQNLTSNQPPAVVDCPFLPYFGT